MSIFFVRSSFHIIVSLKSKYSLFLDENKIFIYLNLKHTQDKQNGMKLRINLMAKIINGFISILLTIIML